MRIFRYIVRSLVYYSKQHLSLFLGMVVSAAVLSGALIVGDSIRYSLNKMVDIRLGKTEYAILCGERYVHANLAEKISKSLNSPVSSVMMLKGIVIKTETGDRLNNIGVLGIDGSFNGINNLPVTIPDEDEALVSSSLATRMGLKAGDDLLIRVESAGLIPVNAPFAQEPVPSVAFRVKIKDIVSNEQLGRLNLGNDQSIAYNVFVSNEFLGKRLDLQGLVNTLLIGGKSEDFTLKDVTATMQANWSLDDIGLSFKKVNDNGSFDLISSRVFIDTVVANVIKDGVLPHQEVLTYLVNDIKIENRHTPYSFASAVSTDISGFKLEPGELLLNRWTANDLDALPGDSVKLTYYEIGSLRELREVSKDFILKAVIENSSPQINSRLMPGFQGFSEAANCSDWEAGVPIDFKRIRDKDENYWDEYKGTPKVILPLSAGENMWANLFGTLTALRFNVSEVNEDKITSVILNKVKPSDIGIQVVDVRDEGAMAAKNAVNFTELFLGMSFFIIVAGILLTVLIYILHFNRRNSETALFSGLGFSNKTILRIRLAESSLVILLGSVAGTLVGVLYNRVLIAGLNSVWNDMVQTDVLMIYVKGTTLLLSIVISIIVAVIPLYLVSIKRLKQPIAWQLKGVVINNQEIIRKKSGGISWGYFMLILSIVLVMYSVATGAYNNAVLYLSSAALFLSGSAMLFYGLLRKPLNAHTSAIPTVSILAMKNLQRNPARSFSVILLLALGTFTVFLTGANRKTFYGMENQRSSGTGGYLLWAETTSPVSFDLNSKEGEERLLINSPQDLEGVSFLQFNRLDGDEASCLNLNQVQRPRLLAVNPEVFDSLGAFSFVKLLPEISDEHPWKGLEEPYNDSTYPAYVDQTVLQYSLQKKLGDTLFYRNEFGKSLSLVLAGAINNTIFQGNILVSQNVFRSQFPSTGGSKTMLIDAPGEKQALLTDILTRSLVDYGIDVTSTSQRLAAFYSVTNTYLTVFMALSGLGFIIGTIGLGIILLRNVQERRQELALLLAVGYSQKQIFKLVFTENLFLLMAGLLIGILAAIIGIMPSLLSPSFDIQGMFLIVLTAGIFLSGLLWIYFPLKSALHKPLIPALRND